MSFFLGVIDKANDFVNADLIQKGMHSMKYLDPDYSNTWVSDNVAFGQHTIYSTLESQNEKLPHYEQTLECCIIGDIRIDYREVLAIELGVDWSEACQWTDSKFVLKSYSKWGKECLKHLYGDYAFAIWDIAKKQLFCARDQIGIKPFYYLELENNLLIFNDLSITPMFSKVLDESWIEDRCNGLISNYDRTFFQNVRKLPPAHFLVQSESLKITKYWSLETKQNNTISSDNVSERLENFFFNAVQERMRSFSPVGIELSGGVDSSSIASVGSKIANKQNQATITFSHGLSDEVRGKYPLFEDESEYWQEVLKYLNNNTHISISSESVGTMSAMIEAVRILTCPPINYFPVMSDILHSSAKQHGCRVLLSGHGGDEGITSRGSDYLKRLATSNQWRMLRTLLLKGKGKQRYYGYLRLLRLFLKIKLKNLKLIIPLLKTIINAITQNNYIYFDNKMPAAQLKYRMHFIIKKLAIMKAYSGLWGQSRVLLPHIINRTEVSAVLLRSRKIEARYPFLDVKLLEFYYSIPPMVLHEYENGRELFKRAMVEYLPDKIRHRSKGSFLIIPEGLYRIVIDLERIMELLNDSKGNNDYNYIRISKLYKMLEEFPDLLYRKSYNLDIKVFLTGVSILMLQKWQREGKIDIGIKC